MTPLPVTVVGGFLGSGKTTLVNHVLSGDHGLRIAVIVNDFGAVNIDAALIASAEGGVVSLANGCVCCALNAGLVEQLEALLARAGELDHVLIEASGVADPGRIMDTVRHARFRGRLRPDAVVVLVDAAGFDAARAVGAGLAETQLDAADLVVLNKTDLATRAELDAWRTRWLPKGGRIVETTVARVPFDVLFGGPAGPAGRPHDHHHHHHDHDLPASVVWRSRAPVDLRALQAALADLPASVYRAKGFVAAADGRVFAAHLVGARLAFEPLRAPPPGFEDESTLVLIGLGPAPDWDAILRRLDTCAATPAPESVR
ncbi:GTP-binding protein [Amaricoccus sp.]|uniref:CobW family GTP-binding protein n=1 Tax=Amaricoccus sp. TaxID=1872485 RepID=UPI001B5376F9|nr:GTP-binding protein [Amaricoccus sp.]MBP7243249.1 GTP-binding protein [Amaricoccus sp.]